MATLLLGKDELLKIAYDQQPGKVEQYKYTPGGGLTRISPGGKPPTTPPPGTSSALITGYLNEAELKMVQHRAANGPFRTEGDLYVAGVKQPSPRGFEYSKTLYDNYITRKWANGGTSNPAVVWRPRPGLRDIVTVTGQFNPSSPTSTEHDREAQRWISQGVGVELMIRPTRTLREMVRDVVYAQAIAPETDLTDTVRWKPSVQGRAPGIGFQWASYLNLLCQLYQLSYYTPAGQTQVYSAAQKNAIDTFFINCGEFSRRSVDDATQGLTDMFPRRLEAVGDNLSLYPATLSSTYAGTVIDRYLNDPYKRRSVNARYNNQRGCHAQLTHYIGHLYGRQNMIDCGRRYFKELVYFGIYPDGSHVELERGSEQTGQVAMKGWSYSVINLSQMIQMAEVEARKGGMNLYDFKSAFGIYSSTDGTTLKGLEKTMIFFANLNINQPAIFAHDTPANQQVAGSLYQIDSTGEVKNPGSRAFHDSTYNIAAKWYRNNQVIQKMALRQPPYPPFVTAGATGSGLHNPATEPFGSMIQNYITDAARGDRPWDAVTNPNPYPVAT